MLVNAVLYTFPDDRADEVEALFRELATATRTEPGCISYEVARGADGERGTFVLFEKWRDQAALDEHFATEHFQRLGTNGVRLLMTSRRGILASLI